MVFLFLQVRIVVSSESMSKFVVDVGVEQFRVWREEMDRPKDTPVLKQWA